jgi:hypothetical protein
MKKKAMAIEIVLIFAGIMGFLGVALLKTTSNNNKQFETSLAQLQSYFIARAGVEHAMLKIKYLHRELYDAICMYQGRNPLFNYTGINIKEPYKKISSTNPGPVFLFKENEVNLKNNSIIADWKEDNIKDEYKNYKSWINSFTKDLQSSYKDENGTIKNSCLSMMDLDKNIITKMTPEDGSSFAFFKQAQYLLASDSLAISAFKITEDNNKIENNIVINFTIKSIFETSKSTTYNYEISRTVTISRD